jgi:hypothetical protein
VTPSRGLVHSRTVEAVLAQAVAAEDAGWYFTHDLPIPECHERVTEMGLHSGADALWFIEEDVIPPPDALAASMLLLRDFDVVAVDYPVGGPRDAWGCAVRDGDEVLWVGFGCTLVRASVFAALERPWFTTDVRYVRSAAQWRPLPANPSNADRWGQQDIHLCHRIRAAGLRIGVVPGMIAGHAHVEHYGRPGSNVGFHDVIVRERIRAEYPGVTA